MRYVYRALRRCSPLQKWRGLETLTTDILKRPRDDKERVVILGSGWGGYTVSRKLSPREFSPVVISPRSYFVFTPLLTDTAGGDLDFSHIVEPVRHPTIRVGFIQAAARAIDLDRKMVLCEPTIVKSGVTLTHTEEDEGGSGVADKWESSETFEIPYDKLIIAVGAISRTFKTPGVKDNAIFFRDIGDSRRVRRRVRECFELAILPTTSDELRKHLLHFAIVGAGPTGTELAAALRDFIATDLITLYPALDGLVRISLYDVAPKVLSMFDESLSRYAQETMKKEGIDVRTSHHIEDLRWGAPGTKPPYEKDPRSCLTLRTKEEGEVGVGMCVWVTGNAMNELITHSLRGVEVFPTKSAIMKDKTGPKGASQRSWAYKKAPKTGALLVDGHLRVQLEDETGNTAVLQDVFALGDNAMLEHASPPATAQVTAQEAKWLSARLNHGDLEKSPPFSFRNMGTLAYIGNERALMQLPNEEGGYLPHKLTGRAAWLVWNSAYLTMTISWRNKLRVAFRWMLNRLFGRDISRY
ncbi:putative pyridine nucleotide-disulfide oxidoreductase [Aspergillus mulundensis]|uniref:NADH dehydrogenase n=1 Tax=Aspergillus mulundensis TaxID=1810919 RepID=A0A3D8QAS3_9EURO|nr:NADH dehydrogenase [Aspergillus mulundensis]RDW58945.1 NADH dehydrogenase [Aspergillus mulundensis]